MKPPSVRVPRAPRAFSPAWLAAFLFAFVLLAATGNLFAQAPPAQPLSSTTPMTGTQTTTGTVPTVPTSAQTPGTPTATPIFSCCEKEIMLKVNDTKPNVRVNARKNVLTETSITITLDFEVDLRFFCKSEDKKCRVYYEVSTGKPPWQEFRRKKWNDIPPARVTETITTGAPLEEKCDGLWHHGTYKFTIQWVIQSVRHLQHPDLRVHLRFPKDMQKKGKQYTIFMTVDAVNDVPPPKVRIVNVKSITP